MAYCKHIDQLVVQTGGEFDNVRDAGTIAPLSGVYRCEGCGRSVVAHNGALLPPADHHSHDDPSPVAWRLVVRSYWS